MLGEILFQNGISKELIKEILFDFHKNGPVNNSHLETLSYLKKNNEEEFKKYEGKLMFLMGLFYKTDNPDTFLEVIYDIYAKSIIEETGHNFTPVQADAYNSIKKYTNFSFSAPTSAGKSFLFQELIKEAQGDIIIVLPSRALLSEYLIKVKNLVSNETLVLQFIEIVNTKRTKKRIYIITPERGEEIFRNIDKLNLELILLDEAQISEEGIRGMKFDSLVRRIDKKLKNIKKVFTHPFVLNPDAQFRKHNITNNIDSETYNQKTVGKIYIEHFKNNFKYFSPFEDKINGKTIENNIVKDVILNKGTVLIYISKSKIYDGSFLTSFADYIELCPELTNENSLFYINKLEEFLGTKGDREKNSILIYLMKKGIVIHHGSIPLKARLIIEEFVNGHHAKICFSTSTLIQGINMPFDIVWINNFSFTGDEDQKTLNLKNLIGRAGRTTIENNYFDYGYVIIEKKNKKLFIERLNKESSLSITSNLDNKTDPNNEDFIDIVEAIKNDTFNIDLQLPESQITRIINANLDSEILFILENFLNKQLEPLTVKEYYRLENSKRKKIKLSFENIYKAHLRRTELSKGEKNVLSTSIPILLWQIQGKSFAEIVSLRYAFLSEKDYRRKLRRQLLAKEINTKEFKLLLSEKKVRFSCIAESLPNKSFKQPVPLFSRNTNVLDIDFDKVIYDTYDYIDKVLSLSIKDPVSSAFLLYYQKTKDIRAKILSNYLKYGTNNETEIWLIKYGFSFDEIEEVIKYVEKIDETEIIFKSTITEFIENPDNFKMVARYL
ncbi:ski2-like helicase [Chryseobacterium gleum]|uniref:Ski2-like helicase n=2 Tax=Chryseobacterium gleum TaxID=250 RepID=A0A3S4NTK4_CHRGE|nr:DEAD/DEAH box helicase [Chryseobacterium gleum]EFK33654.1 helicase C-terminal domain protein [Chryseobacterium gleum ATCC 35910]QQY34415.1 DEAD/DEAH box helicase [Chryseobacterium gleum]VEE06622.1 ski2-like helicase [Chryseobacterium gleum]